MMLLGSLVNMLAIFAGCFVGVTLGRFIPERFNSAIEKGIALCVFYIGLDGVLAGSDTLVAILSMVFGVILGELLDLDGRIHALGDWVERRFAKKQSKTSISEGFVNASLLFCVGAMTIMGALDSGLNGDHATLYAKSHTTYSNNVRERTASARLSVNYSPSEKFSFALNGRGGYSHYRLPQEEISTEEFTFDQNLNMNIALWKAATVSLGEGYNSGSANLGRKSGDYFYSYATLSQKFFDKKLQISVSCYNPFTKYQTYSSTAQTPTYRSQSRSRNHSRQFSIGAYWRFGKQNVQVRKTRKSISNDDMMDGGNKQGGKQ